MTYDGPWSRPCSWVGQASRKRGPFWGSSSAMMFVVVRTAEREEVFGGVAASFTHRVDVVEVGPAFFSADSTAGLGCLALVLVSDSNLMRDRGRNGDALV